MVDDFVYGEVSCISPEAPAPILAVTRNDLTVGGAGNGGAQHCGAEGALRFPRCRQTSLSVAVMLAYQLRGPTR